MIREFIIAIFILQSAIVSSAQKNITQNNQQWLQYYNQLALSKKLTLFSDASLRRIDTFDKWSQITLRVGLGYRLIENLNGVSGLACFILYRNDIPDKIEYRPYQEINTTQGFSKEN